MKYKIFFITVSFIAMFSLGCKKLVNVDPPATSINGENVYESDATAAAVLTGIYINMSSRQFIGGNSLSHLSLYAGLYTDELKLFSGVTGNYISYYRDSLTALFNPSFWTSTYSVIFTLNSAIQGLRVSQNLTPAVKDELTGEALFMRALHYFYLINMYGDVPLPLTTDYKTNATLTRYPANLVYQQVISDLKEAQNLLPANYVDAAGKTTSERVRPNKFAATALIARAYLYIQDWANAEAESSKIINSTAQFSLSPLNNAFKKSSTEAIWQLQPVNLGWNTEAGRIFVIPNSGPSNSFPVYLTDTLLNTFEINDNRKLQWIGKVTPSSGITYNYPAKYKIGTNGNPVDEYYIVFRLGEQLLIRAEARAQQNKIDDSKSDINTIRARAGLGNTTANDKESLLNAILHERQVELFTEWGHRWYDLKRTNKLDALMNAVAAKKGTTWNTNKSVWPIPQSEINLNKNLTQNNGY